MEPSLTVDMCPAQFDHATFVHATSVCASSVHATFLHVTYGNNTFVHATFAKGQHLVVYNCNHSRFIEWLSFYCYSSDQTIIFQSSYRAKPNYVHSTIWQCNTCPCNICPCKTSVHATFVHVTYGHTTCPCNIYQGTTFSSLQLQPL